MSEIAVIVPVLARPHRAAPLAASVAAATSVEHDLVFVCSPDDLEQIAACVATDAFVLVADWQPGPGDYARKIQLGYRQTSAPFVFTGADDLDFRPAWAEAALDRIERDEVGVCGTNDHGNPVVKRGEHSTHSLVRRAYIDECGGTFDEEPGQLLYEGYDHQLVDNELVTLAQARDCWTFAPLSIVVHKHPFWDRSVPRDATYEKALARGREDRRIFERRRRAWVAAQRQAVRA